MAGAGLLFLEDEPGHVREESGQAGSFQAPPPGGQPRRGYEAPPVNAGRVVHHVHVEDGHLLVTEAGDGREVPRLGDVVMEHAYLAGVAFPGPGGQVLGHPPLELAGETSIAPYAQVGEELGATGDMPGDGPVMEPIQGEGEWAGAEHDEGERFRLGPATDEPQGHLSPAPDGHLAGVVSQVGGRVDHLPHVPEGREGEKKWEWGDRTNRGRIR